MHCRLSRERSSLRRARGCAATSLRLAAATLSAEAQRRLTVLPIEITTGYRRPDGQWPLRCPVAWPVAEFNARVASHVDAPDPHDRLLGPDQFVVSLRHYRPAESELSRRAPEGRAVGGGGPILAAARRGRADRAFRRRGSGAAVMLPMFAADRLAPSASSHTGSALSAMPEGDLNAGTSRHRR